MSATKTATTEARKSYELFSLMTVGACCWFIGSDLGVFDNFTQFAMSHGLKNVMLLCACIGMGAISAMMRTSVDLRGAIAARIEAEAIAERSGRQDALTGLGNRRHFNEKLTSLLATRGANDAFAVMLIDLDRFKPVNVVHGHAAGNAVLVAVAERLVQVTPPDSIVARLSGDEFAVLVPGVRDEANLGFLAQRILDAVRWRIPWRQVFVEVDATVGIAIADSATCDAEALLHAADVAMDQGKRQGRGLWRFFREEMENAVKTRAQLTADLRAATSNGAIGPFYQPIVSLPGREVVGFEVLARWVHPTLGEIEPQKFIPIAEECGMISELFTRVLKSACADAKSWPGHIRLAVNVSPRQLLDSRLPERVLSVLTQTRFPAERLEIEVGETALINDVETARVTLASLQNLGVGITLDNFGAGPSILHQLGELRFDKLKIDRSYVTALEQDTDRAKLVHAILKLGANLSVQTTAEGIETTDNLDWLASQGCSYGQGHLFGRAMSKRDAEAYIAKSVGLSARKADGRRAITLVGNTR